MRKGGVVLTSTPLAFLWVPVLRSPCEVCLRRHAHLQLRMVSFSVFVNFTKNILDWIRSDWCAGVSPPCFISESLLVVSGGCGCRCKCVHENVLHSCRSVMKAPPLWILLLPPTLKQRLISVQLVIQVDVLPETGRLHSSCPVSCIYCLVLLESWKQNKTKKKKSTKGLKSDVGNLQPVRLRV